MHTGTDVRMQVSTLDPGVWLLVFVISRYAHLCLHKPPLIVRNLGLPALFPVGIHFKKWSTLISQNNDFIMVHLHALEVL